LCLEHIPDGRSGSPTWQLLHLAMNSTEHFPTDSQILIFISMIRLFEDISACFRVRDWMTRSELSLRSFCRDCRTWLYLCCPESAKNVPARMIPAIWLCTTSLRGRNFTRMNSLSIGGAQRNNCCPYDESPRRRLPWKELEGVASPERGPTMSAQPGRGI
jgi:hypothetical protein